MIVPHPQGQNSFHNLALLGVGLADRVLQLREDDDGHEAAAVKLELEDKVACFHKSSVIDGCLRCRSRHRLSVIQLSDVHLSCSCILGMSCTVHPYHLCHQAELTSK